MATSSSASGAKAAESGMKEVEAMKKLLPKAVDSEDVMNPGGVVRVWDRVYRAAGLASADEDARTMVRYAVYIYCSKNGASREGNYAGEFTLANGVVVPASVIPGGAGLLNIRRFMRGNMRESYKMHKSTGCMEEDERYVAKAAALGISAEHAFAMSDWYGDCPYFTPAEKRAYEISFNAGLERARRNRGGTLEKVEQARIARSLEAQGPAEVVPAGSGSVTW